MKYYRILDDVKLVNRWFLGEVNFASEDDVWSYRKAGYVLNPQDDLEVSISENGIPLDITMGEFEILIASKRVADFFTDEEVQKVPIRIIGLEKEAYFILVIKNEVDCVDRERSDYSLWEENNTIRPDLAGKYKMISPIVVNPQLMKGFDIIRIKDFNVAIIVSEKVKLIFEANNIRGVVFKEVS